MKKRKILFVFLFSLFVLLFTGCSRKTVVKKIIIPDMVGMTTKEAEQALISAGIKDFTFKVKNELVYGDKEGEYKTEMFYGYIGNKHVAGEEFDPSLGKKPSFYVTAYNLPKNITEFVESNPDIKRSYDEIFRLFNEKLSLISASSTQNFMKNGYAEVKVQAFIDGDTTYFKDSGADVIKLRYSGVDTPESTAIFEPWGKAASNFTKETLTSAKKIVLTSDSPGLSDSNGRAIGYVWYQDSSDIWHSLNLELVVFCFTKDKADSESSLANLISNAGFAIQYTGRRVWGEKDPNYDYSTAPKNITIQELMTNFSFYYGRKVKITGVVAIMDSGSPIIVDPTTGHGVYYYCSLAKPDIKYNLKVGNLIQIEGVATYFNSSASNLNIDDLDDDLKNGSPQLSGLTSEKQITLISSDNVVNPKVLDVSNLLFENIGMYSEFSNLLVTSIHVASTGSGTTINCKDQTTNKEFSIRIDSSNYYIPSANEEGVKTNEIKVGDKISKVVGYLSYYYGYQLTLTKQKDISINN